VPRVGFPRKLGDMDSLLRVFVPDIAGCDAVYKRLIQVAGLTDVGSSFDMERIKHTTELPLAYAG
jgi:Lrp/AsnC family transcriptional regulator